jgi:hypothetical protein
MSSNSASYSDELEDISYLLDHSPDPSDAEAKLLAFNEKWSDVPPVEIVPGELWNRATFVRYGVRFTKKEDAINNLIASGRAISADEEKFVEYLMTYLYWSPSDPQHMDEPCFQFLRWRFRHLGHLYPIFDDILWPEVVENIPITGYVNDPLRTLFAGKDYYYIYHSEDDSMLRAGKTLEEVYEGLKAGKEGWGDDLWEDEEEDPSGWEGWWGFPCWNEDREAGRWVLRAGVRVEPFVPPSEDI